MSGFIPKFAALMIRRRIIVLLIVAGMTAFLIWNIQYFRLVNDPDTFSPPDHPNMVFNRWAEKNFGMGNVAIIAIKLKEGGQFKSVYNPVTLKKLWHLVKVYEELPHAWKTNYMSLATKKMKYVKGENGWLKVGAMMKDPDAFPMEEQVAYIKEGVELNRLYQNFLVSTDERYLFIYLDFHDSVKDDYLDVWRQIYGRAQEIVADDNHEVLFAGEVPICAWMIAELHNNALLFLSCFVIMFIILWLEFRSLILAIVPCIGASFSFLWTAGFMGLTGFPLSSIAPAILILVLAVGLNHAIQLTRRFCGLISEGKGPDEAAENAIIKLAPASLSSISTDIIGFAVLAIFPVLIYKEYSIFGTFGMFTFLIVCYIMVPVCLSVFITEKQAALIIERGKKEVVYKAVARALSVFMMRGGKWIVISCAAVLVVISFMLIPYTIIGSNLPKLGAKSTSEYTRWDDEIKKTVGTMPFSMALVSRESKRDLLKEPEILNAMDQFEEWFRNEPNGTYIISIADFLSNLHYHIWEMEEDKYCIPDTKGGVADLYFAYRSGGDPSDFDSVISLHSEQGLITGFYKDADPRELRKFQTKLDAKIHDLFDPLMDKYDFDVMHTGSFMGTVFSLLDVTDTYKWTFWIPFVVAVFIAMLVILRSLVASVIILVALMVCIIFQYGWMGFCSTIESPLIKWTGNLNFSTLMMFGMVIGVGVDYSIYITQRLRQELANTGSDLQEALRITYFNTGRSVFLTAVTFCLLLVPLMLTPLANLFSTALILIPDFIVCFFTAVLLVPALYAVFKPKIALVPKGGLNRAA